jgi:hypothetical protein
VQALTGDPPRRLGDLAQWPQHAPRHQPGQPARDHDQGRQHEAVPDEEEARQGGTHDLMTINEGRRGGVIEPVDEIRVDEQVARRQ